MQPKRQVRDVSKTVYNPVVFTRKLRIVTVAVSSICELFLLMIHLVMQVNS